MLNFGLFWVPVTTKEKVASLIRTLTMAHLPCRVAPSNSAGKIVGLEWCHGADMGLPKGTYPLI